MSRREAGFTIVETLIVLAIAGLILLIIFLAVPNLQRSSRNNQRSQDVQTTLQTVSHWELNHAGTLPSGTDPDWRNFLNTYERRKLTYYDTDNITISLNQPTDNPRSYPSRPVGLDDVLITNHAKCVIGGTADNQGAGYSDVVALYAIETSGGATPHCQQL